MAVRSTNEANHGQSSRQSYIHTYFIIIHTYAYLARIQNEQNDAWTLGVAMDSGHKFALCGTSNYFAAISDQHLVRFVGKALAAADHHSAIAALHEHM